MAEIIYPAVLGDYMAFLHLVVGDMPEMPLHVASPEGLGLLPDAVSIAGLAAFREVRWHASSVVIRY
jgi:hypothetical protein